MATLTASARVSRARTHLLLDSPWFGSLSMRLQLTERSEADCPTMQTDATVLEYSQPFVDSLSDAELIGVMAHEVMHCALKHPFRTSGRNLQEWNEACDFAINQLLIDQQFTLPDGALIDPQYAGMSADQIYSIRGKGKQPQQPQQGNGPQGQQGQPQQASGNGPQGNGNGKPSPTGSFGPPMQPSTPDVQGNGPQQSQPDQMTETDWDVATEQASNVARKAGKLGGGIDRAVKDARQSETDWKEILRRFVEQVIPSDYSWSRPNRRFVAQGIYLPGVVKENTPRLAVAVDTSGSIDEATLSLVGQELSQIMLEVRPESLDVVYCDTRIRHSESFNPDEHSEVKLTARGGGGTLFNPVFDHFNEQPEQPAALIYFTDLECSDEPIQPEYPVLWVTTQATRLIGPFGETVRVPV